MRERQKAIVQLRKKQQHTLDDIQDNQTQLASDINSKRGQLKALQTVLCDLCTKVSCMIAGISNKPLA